MIAVAAAIIAMTGLFLASARSASAAPSASQMLATCHGGAVPINSLDDNWHWPPFSYAVTTSRCNDINVKMTQTVDVKTCFAPSSGGEICNGFRTVYAGVWGLAATDVKDGTKFWLLFNSSQARGVAAY